MRPSWTEHLRSWLTPAPRRHGRPTPGTGRLRLEPLETRDTPTIAVTGSPAVWQSVGPVAIQNSSNLILGTAVDNIQIGAVETIAVDPFVPTNAAIASVNGGIWTTTNFTAPTPTWTTTTDALPSLAISTIAYSPIVPNTIFAGTGSYSSGGLSGNFAGGVNNPGSGGPSVGLYRSTDAGATWTQLGAATFSGIRIRNVIPTTLNGGNTLFVTTHDGGAGVAGVYRTDDGGATWTRLSCANGLPDLGVTSMIADAANPNRFYAAPVGGPGAGVYLLDVTGGNAVWSNVTNNLPPAVSLGSRILLASSGFGVGPVFAAVVSPTGIPQGVFRAVPFPGPNPGPTFVWTAIGPNGRPPDVSVGQQGDVHFAIVADPTSDQIVYVAGDRRTTPPFAGNVARGDAIANTWTTITAQPTPAPAPTPGTITPANPAPQPTTSPHPDFRWLVFAGPNAIIAGTDGGVYRVTNPRATGGNPPVWTSINGNLAITELYQADVDNRNTPSPADDFFLAAAQDNGSSEVQPGLPWEEVFSGDGTIVRADPVNGFRYYSAQFFFFGRRNPNGVIVQPAATIIGTAGLTLQGQGSFLPVMTLNQADTNMLLVAGPPRTLFFSTTNGDTFNSVGGIAGGVPANVPNITGEVTASAFGTAQIRFAAYVATNDGNLSRSFDVSSGNGNFVVTNFASVAGGAVAFNVVMDPNNPLIAYAVTNTGVFRTIDGTNWTNISGNILGLVTGSGLTKLNSIALMPNGTITSVDDTLLVGGFGGVFRTAVSGLASPSPLWTEFGGGLPNVVISDLRYNVVGDTIIAGTFGRGVYRLTGATPALTGATVTVSGTGLANNMAVYPDPLNAANYIVDDGQGNTQTFGINNFRNVAFRGLGGADTVIVGSPSATVPGNTVPLSLNITVDAGGDAGDRLVIQDGTDAIGRQVTATATNVGGGVGDTLFTVGGSVTFTGLNAGSVRIVLGNGIDTLKFDDTATLVDTAYTVTSSRITRTGGGTFDYVNAENLFVTGGSGASTIDVQSFATSLTLDGGLGADTAQIPGSAGTDSIVARVLNAAGTGNFAGFPFPVQFAALESLTVNGGGGLNNLAVIDDTDIAWGTPTNPAAGIVVSPTAAGSGFVRVGGVVQIGMTNASNGIFVSGDGNGSGDLDTLLVLGTSAAGRQSAFGEAILGNGRDQYVVTDTGISLASISAGKFFDLGIGTANGVPTFGTVYVATGNESGNDGDQVSVTPSGTLNLLLDGGAPNVNPGDRLTVNGPGPFSSAPVNDPSIGPPHTRISNDFGSLGVLNFEGTGLEGVGLGGGVILVGSDAGPETTVQVFDRLSGAFRFQFIPFPGFFGGASVASGDFTGDGIADIIVGAGPGGGPRVGIFNGLDGSQVADFFGYEESFRGGVNVSAGDFNADGIDDAVLGTGPGGGPRIQVISGRDFSVLRNALVYDARFRGGVQVSTGDVNGDGTPDLVTSPGTTGGPQAVVLNGKNLSQIASFFTFDPASRDGFFTAVGDVNGDGFGDIIAGAGAGGPGRVRVFSGFNRSVLADFHVNDPFDPATATQPQSGSDVGIRVASADLNGDGIDDVITGKGPGSAPIVRGYQLQGVNPQTNALFPTLQEIRRMDLFDGAFGFGIFVGASD